MKASFLNDAKLKQYFWMGLNQMVELSELSYGSVLDVSKCLHRVKRVHLQTKSVNCLVNY